MRPIAAHVRRAGFLLALLTPIVAADAQVAIQVKNGTAWTASIELRSVGPITFRWRWDGTETLNAVAWQFATITPTSTATTRSGDVVASETAMRLPTKAGVFEEFNITPLKTWPDRFYIRVRVNAGRKVAFSRWISVGIVQRTLVVESPTCSMEASKHYRDPKSIVAPKTEPLAGGELVSSSLWNFQKFRFTFRNRLATSVSYRRSFTVHVNDALYTGYQVPTPSADYLDAQRIRVLGAAATDIFDVQLTTVKPFGIVSGFVRVEATATPLEGVGGTCRLVYEIT